MPIKFKKKLLVNELLRKTRDFPLYHATMHAKEIVREGFKTRSELEGRSGLGGRNMVDYISFTASPVIAANIATDLQTMVDIAQGTFDINDVCGELNERDWKQDKLYGDAFGGDKTPCKAMKQALMTEDILSDINKELEWFREHGDSKYDSMTDDEIRRMVLLDRYAIRYVMKREEMGGRPNPII